MLLPGTENKNIVKKERANNMFTGKKLIMVDLALIIALVITKYKSNTPTQPFEYRDCFDNRNVL